MKKTTLTATVLDTKFEWTTELDGTPLAIAAARKGFQEWLNDASSTAKPSKEQELDPAYNMDRNTTEYKAFMAPIRMKAIRTRFGKIKDGSYKPGQGGGGSRKTPEDDAWIQYINSTGHQEGGKPVIKRTLRRAQEWACRQWLLGLYDPGTDERTEIEQNMGKHVTARFVEFVQQEEVNNKMLVMGIEYHKMVASAGNVSMG